ncbi:aminomethyltransferase family protein [Longimicrobium sp.]|uniref:CAF17-like 4Fe-4S cluster assembly/insertion protein YgfZ n=1 Tax=Longimicrobium sp. TaxID=2029185 RepID=UPI002C3FD79C|nr:aminomethyltransferase family protein [Longimicrobium sp.]HSU12869.1 aminomethyltransferase family protein [Longimicrobium sp.]
MVDSIPTSAPSPSPAVEIPPSESPIRARQDAVGAVWTEVAGRRVARHYGDSAGEYRAVREGAGLAERGDRARIRMWGKDPVKMIHGLITNDLLKAAPGQGVYAAMLTPKGRTIAELRIFRRELPSGVEVLVEMPREALDGVREHFRKMVPPMFAKWGDVTDTLAGLGVYGPRSREIVGQVLGIDPPSAEDAHAEADFGGAAVMVAATRYVGLEDGFDLFVAADAAGALWDALAVAGARPIGFGAIETLRIEAGRPRFGADLTEDVIPTEAFEEAGLMERAISFSKGCYTGQEVIVRIAHRGHVNKHLRGLLLGDAPAPAPGTRLVNAETGKDAGWLTSVAHSPLLGQSVALGYVRREVEPGAVVRLGAPDGAMATVAKLPFERPA